MDCVLCSGNGCGFCDFVCLFFGGFQLELDTYISRLGKPMHDVILSSINLERGTYHLVSEYSVRVKGT